MILSIITINLNNRDGLQKTIDSVLSQTWTDFEWIIIDGGSTDGSRELIEQYQEHFTYWCSEPDKGVYNAMNKGIAKAKGTYLNFMNSGDTFYDYDTLEKVFNISRKADILYGDWMQIFKNYSRMRHFPSPVDIFGLWGQNICHQATFIKSSVLKEKGYDESLKIYADWKRWIELAICGASFEALDFPVCKYDMTGISSTDSSLISKEWELLHKVPSSAIIRSLEHLNRYAGSRHTVRARILLEKGGMAALLTKVCLACLDKLFTRTDFSNYPYCD